MRRNFAKGPSKLVRYPKSQVTSDVGGVDLKHIVVIVLKHNGVYIRWVNYRYPRLAAQISESVVWLLGQTAAFCGLPARPSLAWAALLGVMRHGTGTAHSSPDGVEYHHRIPADHHRIPTLLWSPEDPRTFVAHQKIPALLWSPRDPGARIQLWDPREARGPWATFWLTGVGANHASRRAPRAGRAYGEGRAHHRN